jgi:hypothetical protein
MRKLLKIKIIIGLLIVLMTCSMANVSEATLYDRGGGLIYDSFSNITWLQNANYNPDWFWSNWYDAVDVAEDFVYEDTSGSFTKYWVNWRLASAYNIDGSGPCSGYNCTQSEMGHLYYVDLGNTAGALTNTGIFQNIQAGHYWLGEPNFWYFNWATGVQGYADCMYVWPVLDGDVANLTNYLLYNPNDIPEPSTIILLSAGILGLAGLRRKRS